MILKQDVINKHSYGVYYSNNISNVFNENKYEGCCLVEYHKKFIYGYSLGMYYQYNFNKVISLETGLGYLRTGYNDESIYYDDIGVPPRPNDTVNSKDIRNFITIPLEYKTNFKLGKRDFFLSAGFSLDMLVSTKNIYFYTGNPTDNNYSESKSNIFNWTKSQGWKYDKPSELFSTGIILKMGSKFKIKNNISLSIVPNLRLLYLLKFATKNNSYLPEYYNYSIGIATYIGIN